MLVTGMLGAGKTTALRVLEDLGWETIDNFPIRLLERLIDRPSMARIWANITALWPSASIRAPAVSTRMR
jgi:RNase adaptor protein for sRNA GlmZ degradation